MTPEHIDYTDKFGVIYKYTFFEDRGHRWLLQYVGKNWGAARPEEIKKRLQAGDVWPMKIS